MGNLNVKKRIGVFSLFKKAKINIKLRLSSQYTSFKREKSNNFSMEKIQGTRCSERIF